MSDYRWLLRRDLGEDAIRIRWIDSRRRIVPEVESAIESAWQRVLARPGVRLFDGPVVRLESWHVDAGILHLDISRCSYRISVGTHFENPQFATDFGPDVMANPLGVSAGVICAQGLLLMGRRNHSVAYYPGWVHPFAGSLEAAERVDLFDNVRRELREEIHLDAGGIERIRCMGIIEDLRLRHPEMVFLVHTSRTREQIERTLDADEHTALVAIDPRSSDLPADEQFTPMAQAIIDAARSEHR